MMGRRQFSSRDAGAPEQLPLLSPKARTRIEPEQAAKVAIARRAKPATRPGDVKLVLTLEVRRQLAERLSARAIREGKNLEGIVVDILEAGAK